MAGRNERLLHGLQPDDRIIEIGPLHSPIAPKAAGFATTVVDHLPREGLLAKYAGEKGVDPASIEAVDIVWSGGPLHEAFPAEQHGRYTLLLASHVFEHLPDAIAFLDSAARLLHPERGILGLALPDKRWCFDVLKPVSTTGQMLAAHRERRRHHSPATLFDHAAYSAGNQGQPGWSRETPDDPAFYVPLETAWTAFTSWTSDEDAPYADCHAWQFTPASFELLILELGAIGAIDWQIDWIEPQPAVEFTARLRRGRAAFASPAERERRRLALLRQCAVELREGADWLLGDARPQGPEDVGAMPDIAGLETRLAALEAATGAATAPLHLLEEQLGRIEHQGVGALRAEVSALRNELRPIASLLQALLPIRGVVARLRGRHGP